MAEPDLITILRTAAEDAEMAKERGLPVLYNSDDESLATIHPKYLRLAADRLEHAGCPMCDNGEHPSFEEGKCTCCGFPEAHMPEVTFT